MDGPRRMNANARRMLRPAPGYLAALRLTWLATAVTFTSATPGIALPFNAQVPVVARVGEPYEFQFSSSTFAPDNANFTYSLSDQPAWLSLDSVTRTLSGAPSSADEGASSFTLTAADDTGAAHIPCVLVVSKDPPPQIEWSITQQLAADANLSSSDPAVITMLPSREFRLTFRQDSFIDIVQRKLSYYAALIDHTPLPAWLEFEDKTLTFFGTSPQLSAFPQSWDVELIASDVEGFAGAAASFTFAIGIQKLAFAPGMQTVNMTAGEELRYNELADTLFLNGINVDAAIIKSADASVPSWMDFDPQTLGLSGMVPPGAPDQNITVSVTDELGNEATAIVMLKNGVASVFAAKIPTLTAHSGKEFSYHFPDSLFAPHVPSLMVTLPETATWLHFNPETRTLSGTVPKETTDSTIEGTITAKSSDAAPGEDQTFAISIKAATPTVPSPRKTSTPGSDTSTSTPIPLAAVAAGEGHHLSTGAVAGIVVGTLVAIAIIAALLVLCWRRRRRTEGYVEAVSPEKRTISRPILPPDAGSIAVTTDVHRDIERYADSGDRLAPLQTEPAPHIALDLPSKPGKNHMKWSKRFSRISLASSIGNGEEAIRADSNIPTWGVDATALHTTPHDSFSVPAEIARSSRPLSDRSPTKAALRRLREKRESRQSVGLGIDTGGALLLPRHSSKGARTRRRPVSSLGQSTMQDRSSMATQSTRGTSVLSTRPSDFPRPPTRSTMTDSKSFLTWGPEGKRKSIRLVARSDSTLDNRSLQDKRQSFIRNRASTSLASPLFAHGSRAPTDPRMNGHSSVNGSVAGSSRRTKRGRSQVTSYSNSSSLEPPPRDPRRLSAKLRSRFAPSFPRAVTKSTLGADDEGVENESDSEYDSTSESITESDLAAEMALPRHKRSWVLPGEASPTPPPAPPTSRQVSRGVTPSSGGGAPRQKWKERLRERSSSPLATAVAVSVGDTQPSTNPAQGSEKRRSRLSEPMALVSNDSLSKAKLERPRLVHTGSKRPVSVERVQRLSSLRAETEDVRPGSEMWEAMEEAGLMPPTIGEGREGTGRSDRSGPAFLKFGKHIQKRQLEIPEYAASFVDYKALKKLIKKLSTTPIINAQHAASAGEAAQDAQAALQANKGTFFFRLERELEKVNTFYLQKEAELKLRLKTLLDKQRDLKSRSRPASKLSSNYVTLDEGFQLFSNDLDKLQQFVQVNQTAFSKILKKLRTKELYLSRAVDVQPCFDREVISKLSDQARDGQLELQAWAEGEQITYTPSVELENRVPGPGRDDDIETQVMQAVNAGNVAVLEDWIQRAPTQDDAQKRISRMFLDTVNTASPKAQQYLYRTDRIDFNYADPINRRNCIHEAAVSGKIDVLRAALTKGADIRAPDVYGRIPLHYACMHGQLEMVQALAQAGPDTVNTKDYDNFTPLIHGVVRAEAGSVEAMLALGAYVDPPGDADHNPLDLACQYGSPLIIRQMLQYGPKILPDAEGLFPQHLVARFGGARETLQLLKEYGVDMDQQDKLYQWTPIFHAASEGHLHCLQQLLEFRVKANAKDEKGLSAMYYAAWEGHLDCMQLLARASAAQVEPARAPVAPVMPPPSLTASTGMVPQDDPETIPDLILPPPIIPLRRYGHNFLDTTKTFILLSFDELGSDAIEFYDDNKYPAARLTISSKSSDLIPRSVPLPVQDDAKTISFQIENLSTFSIDFDIYPTFGSKVIARAAASSRVFTGKASSSGIWHLELFDPRLRTIGRINFRYQVVTPFHGIPLEITTFATYWKATSQDDAHPSNLITGSSLSGDFLRLFVQVTRDCVPVLFNDWALPSSKNDLISRMTYQEFETAGLEAGRGRGVVQGLVGSGIDRNNLANAQRQIARSYASLADALAVLPPDLHLEIHVCYPSRAEEEQLHLGPSQNMNNVVDNVLAVVFAHARHLRETQLQATKEDELRNFVFSSYNPDICTALNWKQPNYPVLLCNELGVAPPDEQQQPSASNTINNCGRTSMSIKESVRIATSNNLMGLICTSRLLDLVPALVASVKEAGLVLISDYSRDVKRTSPASVMSLPQGVDGLLMDNAVLRFKDAIDQ
ncbi:phosphate system positive regulatory protein pho81 [Saxophila tyrrhenica]|uniref:Phosphate system positive regulatory protein pho81 n=1 Tax=Saxophila tyrrhenica TaxID=1690608 RepID=A0AAV9PGK7_9PEZI|nr:phosphate system positive regulatory protein pho81 [Saxophila tyrrhenica]